MRLAEQLITKLVEGSNPPSKVVDLAKKHGGVYAGITGQDWVFRFHSEDKADEFWDDAEDMELDVSVDGTRAYLTRSKDDEAEFRKLCPDCGSKDIKVVSTGQGGWSEDYECSHCGDEFTVEYNHSNDSGTIQ